MTHARLRRALVSAAPPDEVGAQRRAWRIVRASFEEREPTPWPRRHARPLLVAAAGVAVLAAAVSSPGRAVIDDVRDAIGHERVVGVRQARPSLTSLPTEGRVLVAGPTGAWIVSADGSKRRLGRYREASWSPRGLHVVATNRSQLAALRPKGEVRWSLARPAVRSARWSPSGFRVAYLSGANLRVVAGDGTGDRRVDGAQVVAPAWRPGDEHVLAYADAGGNVNVLDVDTRETLWTATASAGLPLRLEWSADGTRLLVVRRVTRGRFALVTFDEGGRRLQRLEVPGTVVAAAFSPVERRFALAVTRAGGSELLVVDGDSLREQEVVFSGRGRFSDVAWSPGGRWLLLGWESADQWLFIRSTPVEKIKAISSLSAQFDPGGTGAPGFPAIEGWCCPR